MNKTARFVHGFGISPECTYLHAVKTEHIMATEKKSWGKDLLVAFAATTLSIILTFGTTAVVNRVKQKQERKLTALMVMGSIEAFARDLEQLEEFTAQHDSVATWLLNLPIEDVARLGDEPLLDTFNDVLELGVLNHDRTAETIFSSHIDTWKNMGNFKFIDNVGWCFASMNSLEEDYNQKVLKIAFSSEDIKVHPANYPGNSRVEKFLRNDEVRSCLKKIHYLRRTLRYQIANIRMENRNNKRLIGISEKEVMAFTDNLGAADDYENEILNPNDFESPAIEVDSLNANLPIARQVDSLLRVI